MVKVMRGDQGYCAVSRLADVIATSFKINFYSTTKKKQMTPNMGLFSKQKKNCILLHEVYYKVLEELNIKKI